MLNGATVVNAQTLFPDLWAAAPASWKSGSSLNLPNIADRTIESSGTTARGATGGSNSRTIATGNLPAHSHTINHGHGVTDPGHHHAVIVHWLNEAPTGDQVIGGSTQYGKRSAQTTTTGLTVNNYDGSSSSVGSGTALDTTPAHLALNAMIKAH
jgi:hypothetical protein